MLQVFNTLSRKMEIFKPIKNNKVKMFVCGPTVYDYMHLGHARTYLAYDIIARYLRFLGYSVFYIMNITDVDDKIINRAEEEGVEPLELARRFEKYFYEDMERLGIRSINLYARASEHIDEIIEQIKILLDKKYAYITETGIYFEVEKFSDYGKLSHQRPEELKRHRIEPDPTKKDPRDFALWKFKKRGVWWSSPWGDGRPGWHIEDTAITLTYFGEQYDIHGGAVELTFPHHEAEIAQAEATTGVKPFVKYWIHTGILTVDGVKMSKSLGNFVTVRDALKRFEADVLRLYFASTHYRSTVDYSEDELEKTERSLEGIRNTLSRFSELRRVEEDVGSELLERIRKLGLEFIQSMNWDFNTPKALSSFYKMMREINRFMELNSRIGAKIASEVENEVGRLAGVIGISLGRKRSGRERLVVDLVETLLELRQHFRERKMYGEADYIRSRLQELGIRIEDTKDGTRWRI